MFVSWMCTLVLLVVVHRSAAEPFSAAREASRQERFLLSVMKFRNTRCEETVEGRVVEGVCQHRAECRYLKGNSIGSCAVFGTCCAIERSCNNVTSLKVSYFVSPPAGTENFCNFKVDVINRDVCQIRLDFEEFSLAQPSKTDTGSNAAYKCQKDSFTATSLLTGTNLFPSLCGENKGQHVYLPVNTSQGGDSVALTFMVASRQANPRLAAPRWRIKVSQIECTGMTNDYSSIAASINTLNNQRWDKQVPANDHIRQAPPGCLQYFTERTGVYETFNYMDGLGPYIGNLNYAICFRKTPDMCGIRHTPVTFLLSANAATHNFTNSDCDVGAGNEMPSQDYLYVPEGFTMSGVIASKFCGSAINSTNYIISVAPGPAYAFFRSDSFAYPLTSREQGFRINYELLNSCYFK